mgnify:CR=1 FL=1
MASPTSALRVVTEVIKSPKFWPIGSGWTIPGKAGLCSLWISVTVVLPPSRSLDLMKYLKNDFKYYIDWCGSLFWIEVLEEENIQIKEMKETIINLGGYLTIVKKSESLSSDIDLFTINDTRLLLSQKIKESFDPKKLLNPGKMYRGL